MGRSGAMIVMLGALLGCGLGPAVSINSQPVYDPGNRLPGTGALNADLQGCINFVMNQRGISDPGELTALSCSNSGVTELDNIARLSGLRFLDLRNNNISNVTPLEDLRMLSGLNLNNNAIRDISPLFNIPTLATVSLLGNDDIPCSQIASLRVRLGNNITPPEACRDNSR